MRPKVKAIGSHCKLELDLVFEEAMLYPSHWKQISVNLCFAVAVIQPFWKTKPEVYRKIVEERAIVVSAQSSPKIRLRGGGIINTADDFAFEEIQKYEKLDEHLNLISNLKWQKESSNIELDVHVLGFKAHLLVHVTPSAPDVKPPILKFEVLKGLLEGLVGELTFTSLKNNQTEVGIDASTDEEKGFFSRTFWSLTLEGVMKKTAESIRSYLESEWQKQKETNERKS